MLQGNQVKLKTTFEQHLTWKFLGAYAPASRFSMQKHAGSQEPQAQAPSPVTRESDMVCVWESKYLFFFSATRN